MSMDQEAKRGLTSGYFDFCDGGRFESVVSLAFAVDVDLDELYGFADAMPKAIWVAHAIRDVGVVV